MKKMVFLLSTLLAINISSASQANKVIIEFGNNCVHGLYSLKHSKHQLFANCSKGNVADIGFINMGKLSELSRDWKPSLRYWFSKETWSIGATSVAFILPQKLVFVANDSVAGYGGVYQLDLAKRKSVLFYPKIKKEILEESIYRILDVDTSRNKITIEVEPVNKKISKKTYEIKF